MVLRMAWQRKFKSKFASLTVLHAAPYRTESNVQMRNCRKAVLSVQDSD
jgi:hypothetical protein